MELLDSVKERMKKMGHVKDEIGSSPAGKEGTWRFAEEVSDEFEGSTLDRTKWDPFNKNWKGRAPGWFRGDNVTVSDGCMQLQCRLDEAPQGYAEDYHTFSTSFVRSKTQIRYGYFEALVQPSNSVTSSAWWLVRNDKQRWNEIDIFEVSQSNGHECGFHTNAHVFRVNGEKLAPKLSHPKRIELPFKTCAKAYKVGMEWDAELIQWIVDGKVVRTLKNDHWHDGMWVQFDCETMGNWFGIPDADDPRLPATFKVHYVRAWQKM